MVEDNKANEILVSTWLQKDGHETAVAANGIEAVEAVQNVDFDVVLMDIQMPEMDGLEATDKIRALPGPPGQIPIIAMTANAISGDRERCLDAGMDDYISKPFVAEELFEKVGYWARVTAARRAATDTSDHGSAHGAANGQSYDLSAEAQSALDGLLAELRGLDLSSGKA